MEKRKKIDKSAYVRELLDRALDEDLLEYICEQIKNHKMTAWKGANILHLTLRQMLEELGKRDISLYNEKSLQEDFESAGI